MEKQKPQEDPFAMKPCRQADIYMWQRKGGWGVDSRAPPGKPPPSLSCSCPGFFSRPRTRTIQIKMGQKSKGTASPISSKGIFSTPASNFFKKIGLDGVNIQIIPIYYQFSTGTSSKNT